MGYLRRKQLPPPGSSCACAFGSRHGRGLPGTLPRRHLKPENVLFSDEGAPLVADLGLANHFRADAPGASRSVSLSRAGEIRGARRASRPIERTRELVETLVKVGQAVAHAHERGILHREDLKPANVMLGRFAAIDALSLSIRLDPSNADGHFFRGNGRSFANLKALAVEDYGRATELGHPHAQAARADLFLQNGRADLAREELDLHLARHPDDVQAWCLRGFAKEKLGDEKGSLADWRKGLERGPPPAMAAMVRQALARHGAKE